MKSSRWLYEIMKCAILLCITLGAISASALESRTEELTNADLPPASNVLPNEDVAIAVAIEILKPIYGVAQIEHEMPFHARLEGAAWKVEGSLAEGHLGGVATIKIEKETGRVITIYHTQ